MGTENASSSCFPSSSTSTPRWTYEYDVFLSFRGSDTRKKFTSHLYEALKRNGIITFRDDESLDRGAFIKPELLKAIEESKIAVVIFSRDYASSSWCLTELAKIVECMDKKKLTVLPVFHDVDPSDVRKLRGTFEDAFAKHLIDNTENVQTWKDAVTEVAGISGWDLRDEPESTVIKKIIQRINNELDREVPSVSEHLIGMESRVQEMLDLCLGERLDCVRFIGICGIGGVGKTTLAREIYNKIFCDFEASCFIDNIREESENQCLVSLQKQLLSKILMSTQKKISKVDEGISVLSKRPRNKKVLIVLDDVNEEEQLKALAGKDEWFGVGSIIIVTSRDRHLLRRHGVKHIYEAKELDYDEALELFSWKAFKKPHLEENYVDLSNLFVMYVDGLPLALEVLGSLLFGKRIDDWESALEKLEKEPDNKIFNILKISFDGLTKMQQDLFLDIACFFKGEYKDGKIDILQSFGFCPAYNIGVLVDRSLITIDEYGTLWMHDLLQEMGRDIVRRESLKELGRRSRLWRYEDVLHVLKNNVGTEFVEGIVLMTHAINKEHLSVEAFSKMTNLRFLKIGYVQPPQDLIKGPIQLPQGLNYLSDELRVIDWHGYPLKSLPTSFQPNKLVELRMHCSDIEQLWKGIMILNELKLIDLSDSQNLIEIPDLSGAPNLKQLILQRCTRLYEIHASLGDLKRLVRLDLNGCKRLKSLPHKINLEALEFFNLSGCSKVKKFPAIVENIPRLSKLYLSETAIKDLSLLVIHSTGLIELDLRDCKNLSSLPTAICSLMSLKTLNLSGCSKLDELPENLGKIEGLEKLDLSGTAITGLPSSIEHLKNLKLLSLSGCAGLSSKGALTEVPQGLSYLSNKLHTIDWHGYPLKSMPISFQPNKLVELRMHHSNIKQLWKGIMVLNELKVIDLNDSQNLIEIPDLSGVLNLKQLILRHCTGLYKIHASLGDLKRLILLDLNGCKRLECLPHKINLEALEFFNLSGCSKLKKFPDIVENMPCLSKLFLSETAIKDLSSLVIHSTGLMELDLRDCKNLSSLPIAICSLMSLKTLNLSGCSKLDKLPENLGEIEGLEELDLSGTAITGLPSPIIYLKNLKVLYLPSSIIHLKNLKVLSLSGCAGLSSRAALTEIANLSGWHLEDNSELKVIKKIIQRINSELDHEVPHLDSDWVDLAAMVPFHPVDQKDKGSQSLPSQSPHDRLSWARKEARWKALHDRSYLVRKEARWIGQLNLNLNLKPSQLLIIDWGLKMSPSQLLILDLELMMSRKLESLPMMMDWGINLPSQMRVMMLPSQMRAMMNLDSQMRAIGETEEAESPQSSIKLKRLESSSLTIYQGFCIFVLGLAVFSFLIKFLLLIKKKKLPWEEIEDCESPRSSTKWKRLYLKIVDSEIKEAESLPSELPAGPSERNKLYFFFWHAYSPVMYSLCEVDVPIPLPPPPSKADQDDRISNPKSLSPILQLKTGKYADGMCCVQLGSILYFLGGEMNIDNPYIDEDVKKELKNVEPDVLPKVVYIFDLAIDHEVKDDDDLLTSTPMNYGKASPLAFVADEKIYVIGSTIRDLEVNGIPYFEMFDPKVDKWSVLENPPEINVNTIWVGHAVVGRKALLVGWRRKKKHLYCFDLDTCEWASISIPDYAGNFSGNTEFVGNTFYGCYYDTVAAIAPLVGEEKDELKEEKEQEEAEEKDFQQMFKHHRLLQVSEDLGMDAIFNVPPQLQYSSSLLHLGKMYFCYVRTGMPPHPNPILANDLVIGDDKKRFISIVIFQAIGKTCDSRFFRAKFLHSEHYVVDSPFPNDGFIRGCYVFGSGSTESSKQISI